MDVVAAVGARLGKPDVWRDLTDLAMLGTVADIVPLHGLSFYTRFGPVLSVIWAGISLVAGLTRYRRKC